MNIRSLYQALVILSAFLLVSGCGFQMRGSYQLPPSMQQTEISGKYSPDLYRELKHNFEAASATLSRSKGEESGVTQLRIYQDKVDRRVLTIGGQTGKAAEYELFYILEFDVVDGKGNIMLPRQRMNLTQDYLYEQTNVLGTGRQETLLRDDLRRKIVGQMMRRFQSQAR